MEGTLKAGDRIRFMASGKEFEVNDVGIFQPYLTSCDVLKAGDVGYVTASMKNVRDTRVGDTITHADRPAEEPLPGYKSITPMVYCGIYPADGAEYEDLRDALENSSSMMPLSCLSLKLQQLWVSGFAAVFWDCCIWRLYRSGWSGNTIWT